MSDWYFVLLINPSNRVRFALTEEDGSVMTFTSAKAAGEAADKTLFGSHQSYDIYNLHNVE
jgi:hypothetical protein